MATAQQQQLTWPTWNELSDIFSKNPNSATTLSDATLSDGSSSAAAALMITPPGSPANWLEYQLEPPGHLSAIMYCRNPFYADAPAGLRAQMTIDAATEVATDIDTKIRTTGWARYRKKALEWLGGGCKDPEARRDLWDILCTIYGYQSIVIDSVDSGHIRFAPADPRTWTADAPLIIVNESLTHLWTTSRWTGTEILSWIIERTPDVEWPVAEGSKTELLALWEIEPAYSPEDRKKLKDQLAALVGRAQAIRHLRGIGGSGTTATA